MLDIGLRITYLAAIGLSLYTAGWLMLKADRNRMTGALAACQILVIIWCVPQLFIAIPMELGMKYFFYAVSYIGISFIGPAWLVFAFLYSGRRVNRWMAVLLFGISALHYSILLTNDYHHLFYRVFEINDVVYGTVFYIHMGYTYSCVLAGMAVVLAEFWKKRVAAVNIAMILLAAAVPLGFNVLYMSRIVKTGFDLTPPAFALSGLLMLLAVFRYDFLDINPLAFERVFAEIGEGVVIYNRRGKITYCNQAAAQWLGLQAGQRMDGWQPEKSGDLIVLADGRRIEVTQYLHRDKHGRMIAGNLMFTDVGKYYELLEQGKELAISNQKLAIEIERNRIAQEVHDTTGHTLTMINSLLKLLKVEYKTGTDPMQMEAYLAQAQELATGGIRELRVSINNLRQADFAGLVTQGVYQLTEQVKEIEVEVNVQGTDGPEYSHLSPVVYDCLREAITNCLKYAQATHMDVILKFLGESLGLYIFDNGMGCEDIQENNGIRGIRERVEQCGGQVRFVSAPGEGFQISIKFPAAKLGN